MMSGRMHLLGHTRHIGMPTSGRYVYRTEGGWYWQCDLHDDDEAQPDQSGDVVPTQRQAFDGAMAHAKVCCELHRDHHTHDSRASRDACSSGHCDHSTIVHIDGRPVRTEKPFVYCGRGPCWMEDGHDGDCMQDGHDRQPAR